MTSSREKPRLIIADDNICDTGGHYFELASLMLQGAQQLGYQGVLATNASFREKLHPRPEFDIHPIFNTRRLVHWSLGVDGNSQYRRDTQGRSVGGNLVQNTWVNTVDRLRPKRPPRAMLERWSDGMVRLLTQLQPTSADCLLVNTGDDFAMLALAAALQRCDVPPIRIDVLFHFALYDGARPSRRRLTELGRQVNEVRARLSKHRMYLHATTINLTEQLRQAGVQVDDVPYPTRRRTIHPPITGRDIGTPWRTILAGLPRAEKGKGAIFDMLVDIEQSQLRSGRFRLSMQMPSRRWRRMIPSSLRTEYQQALDGCGQQMFQIMTNNLSQESYHDWLDTGDVGLFLYDPDRYVARCSGVLLEMMVRGIPVIVPDRCWLADQVRLAGGDGSIGLIYRDRKAISDVMDRFAREGQDISRRANEYADTIAARHCGINTLRQMGIPIVADHHIRAAS